MASKKVFILDNSYYCFNHSFNAKPLYNPKQYDLYLIISEFGASFFQNSNQTKFYRKIITTNDFSSKKILSLIQENLSQNDVLNVVTTSEETIAVCGQVRKNLSIDIDDYSRFSNKHIMKQKLRDLSEISIPKYVLFDPKEYIHQEKIYLHKILEQVSFPLFAKPIQLCSSMHLKKIENQEQLETWAKSLDINSHTYELDEFIDGTMYHCDSYIKDHKILFSFISQNSRPCYDFTTGRIKGTIVLPPDHQDAVELTKLTEITLKKLGLPKAGVTHLEIIKNKKGEVFFIEIAHRAPGCLIPQMYQVHANIDTVSAHLLLQMDPKYFPIPERKIYTAWLCYPKLPGIVKEFISPPKDLTSQYELKWNTNIGDKITTYSKFGRDYIGTLFMKNCCFESLYKEFMRMNNLMLCTIGTS